MSILKPPINKDDLDQTKAYHIVPSDDNWSQGVVCGELTRTDNKVHYEYFSCWELVCSNCGKSTDIGNYDKVFIGKENDFGESW